MNRDDIHHREGGGANGWWVKVWGMGDGAAADLNEWVRSSEAKAARRPTP
jgi:hypothetical protein